MVICGTRLFCGNVLLYDFHFFDAEPQFNVDTNKRYHLRIHHKELEKLKNMLA